MMGEVSWDPKNEDDRGLLSIQSSLVGRYVFKLKRMHPTAEVENSKSMD